MLQRLVGADRAAELHPRAEVFDRRGLQRFHQAQPFGAQRKNTQAGDLLDNVEASVGPSHQRVGAERDVAQIEFGCAATVDQRVGANSDAGSIERQDEERDAGRFVEAATHARADESMRTGLRVQHH
ncbi:hypothetical protein D3C87_1612970 [compost metagenome]